jgi:translation initiation factor 1
MSSSNTRLAYSTDPRAATDRSSPKTLAAELERKTKGARLRLEKRASSRVVTVIADVPGTGTEIEALAKLLKARCGTGGTVSNGTIELQGDKRDAAEKVLSEKRIPHKRAGG